VRAARIRCIGIVNRGDAAMRCLRTVKALRARERSDLRAAVLYADVDRDAPFVRHADAAVRLAAGGAEVGAYLDQDAIVRALRVVNADTVWPGWGFVAEDPTFADRVAAEGMCFLGPSGAVMRALGDKIAAKQLAERVGIAVAPWSGDGGGGRGAARLSAGREGGGRRRRARHSRRRRRRDAAGGLSLRRRGGAGGVRRRPPLSRAEGGRRAPRRGTDCRRHVRSRVHSRCA